ncbi:MAG TPA: hypothetical protein DGG95_16715, partial [Cytophagales bacterium]|nr:hypothetical protein [Cytophagales bacterium]
MTLVKSKVGLGGIKNFSSLTKLADLKYLEIWQVRGLTDIEFLSQLETLQFLFLQSLPQITKFPDLKNCKNLRRIVMENMKVLKDFTGIKCAPNLKEFCIAQANKQEVDDLLPVLEVVGLEKAGAYFGNDQKSN